ncbi:hypothetical protein [Nocardioides sp. 1609]|uniref:hypothetical protein n=1 Tax=Nocardioides sp. 1609 TaxID=2508327 RepID=UPI00106F7081|nr:hypothetical protein [Nocardioides sp. 1609]
MSTRVLVPLLTAVLLGALCGVGVACGAALLADDPRPSEPPPTPPVAQSPPATTGPPGGSAPREVLRAWDEARAVAWTSGDTAALGRLYTARSVAGRRDVAMLEAWNDRGRRVTEMSTQVLALEVVSSDRGRLVLEVTDRLARVAAGGTELPADRVSTRCLVLRAGGDAGWRVASVVSRPTR